MPATRRPLVAVKRGAAAGAREVREGVVMDTPRKPWVFKYPGLGSADEEVRPGLSAAQLYQLDGYRAIPLVAALDIVLLVGSEDQHPATNSDITAAFAEALEANNIDVDVVTVEGANHNNVVDPTSEHGQATLQVMADILTNTR